MSVYLQLEQQKTELSSAINHLYLQEESALFNLNYQEAELCRQEWQDLLLKKQTVEKMISDYTDTVNNRLCNCGSGLPWVHCIGINGDIGHCG